MLEPMSTSGKFGIWLSMHRKAVIFAVIIFLVSSLSFAAGYLANREINHAPIVIEKCSP